jgi:hypothetical protein
MIDGVGCRCFGVNAGYWRDSPNLDFRIFASASTGEILSQHWEAKNDGLRFAISPTGACSIAGSLHRYKNPDGNNHNDFTFSELETALLDLQYKYGILLSDAVIHSIEIGVNIQLDISPEQILKSVICHKGKPFTHLDKANYAIGLVCCHTEYDIKLYNKSLQCCTENCKPDTLRYEVKIKRMRAIEPYHIGTLADLQNAEKVAGLLGLLLERLSEIVFFDFNCSVDKMSKFQKLNWSQYGNPNYWRSLSRNTLYKARKRFEILSIKYKAENIRAKLAEAVLIKWTDLMEFKRKNRRRFHRFKTELKAQLSATFSHLEYVLESVAEGGTQNPKKINEHFGGKNAVQKRTQKKRFCMICGRDISHQRKDSRFCSEKDFGKEAKRCRNKDSNRRMILKRKIKNAVMKDCFLLITCTDTEGNSYTDTLAASKISPTREWLNRVVGVEILKEPPELLGGKKAKEFIHNLK